MYAVCKCNISNVIACITQEHLLKYYHVYGKFNIWIICNQTIWLYLSSLKLCALKVYVVYENRVANSRFCYEWGLVQNICIYLNKIKPSYWIVSTIILHNFKIHFCFMLKEYYLFSFLLHQFLSRLAPLWKAEILYPIKTVAHSSLFRYEFLSPTWSCHCLHTQ